MIVNYFGHINHPTLSKLDLSLVTDKLVLIAYEHARETGDAIHEWIDPVYCTCGFYSVNEKGDEIRWEVNTSQLKNCSGPLFTHFKTFEGRKKLAHMITHDTLGEILE